MFARNDLILIPAGSSDGLQWISHAHCVLSGPDGFSDKYILGLTYTDDQVIKDLLTRTLGIQDATVEEVLSNLTNGIPSENFLKASYKYMARKIIHLTDLRIATVR